MTRPETGAGRAGAQASEDADTEDMNNRAAGQPVGPERQEQQERQERPARYVFAARSARALSPTQAHFLQLALQYLSINIEAPRPPDLAMLFAPPQSAGLVGPAPPGFCADVRLEIGFGAGEHLIAQARRHPHTGFIGCEAFTSGVARLAAAVIRQKLHNIRIFAGDAHLLLKWLAATHHTPAEHIHRCPRRSGACASNARLSCIDLLFPDPWPKKRHHKRRFASHENLELAGKALQAGGMLRIASDSPGYVCSALATALAHSPFIWTAHGPEDWRRPFAGWPGTRYEAKARKAGRPVYFLQLHNTGGPAA